MPRPYDSPSIVLHDDDVDDEYTTNIYMGKRPDIVIFGFPIEKTDDVKDWLINNCDVSKDDIIYSGSRPWIIVRPPSQKVAYLLKSLQGTTLKEKGQHDQDLIIIIGAFETEDSSYLMPDQNTESSSSSSSDADSVTSSRMSNPSQVQTEPSGRGLTLLSLFHWPWNNAMNERNKPRSTNTRNQRSLLYGVPSFFVNIFHQIFGTNNS